MKSHAKTFENRLQVEFSPVAVALLAAAVFSQAALSQEPAKPAGNEPEAAASEAADAVEAVEGKLPLEIEFIARFAQNYTLTFSSKLDEERFQVTREKTANYPRDTSILKIGDTLDEKIRLDEYEEKSGRSPLGVKIDTSQLTVTWLETGKKVILTRRVPETIPTFYAKLTSEGWEDYVKEGQAFSVPGKPKLKIKLVKVEKDAAHLEFKDTDGVLRKTSIAVKAR